VDVGLALPHHLPWEALAASAVRAEALGFGSVWVADPPAQRAARALSPAQGAARALSPAQGAGFDPIVVLGALGRLTTTVRLGMTMWISRRPASVAAKALATVDVLTGGRLTVALGAGPDDESDETLARLDEALHVIKGMFGGGPFSFDGRYERVTDARCRPRPVQRPHPPLWAGGMGDDRLLEIVARHADGWNTVWTGTADGWRRRVAVLDAACERIGRDPGSVTRSVGLHALVGEDEADLGRRFERLRRLSSPGALDGVDLAAWRHGGLVGTVEQAREQLEEWQSLGASGLVLAAGAVLSAPTSGGDVELLASACRI